jgi:hypothetical protein
LIDPASPAEEKHLGVIAYGVVGALIGLMVGIYAALLMNYMRT